MPIRFEQPSPMAPDISVAGGRAQIATHDFPSIVAMYEAANRNQLAASEASARIGLQASAATAANMQRAEFESADAARQQRQFAAQLYPSQRDQFVAQERRAEQQQHFQEQQWLMQQDLSQKEMMQLQTAQAGLATVMGDPGVSDAEKQEAMQLYQQHINPLKVRQQRMQAKQEQLQTEAAVRAGTMQAVMENGTAEQRAKAFGKRVVPAVTPDGQPILDAQGQPIYGWLNDKGNFEPFKESGSKDAASQQAFKEREHEADQQQKDADRYFARREKLEELINKEIDAGLLGAKDKVDRPAAVRVKLTEWGMAPDVNSHVAARAAERAALRGAKPQIGGPMPAAGATPAAGAAPQPSPMQQLAQPTPAAAAALDAVPKDSGEKAGPFPLNDWSSKANPMQAKFMQKLADFRASVGGAEKGGDEGMILQATDFLANVMANFGRIDSPLMSEEQKKNVTASLDIIRRSKANVSKPVGRYGELRPVK